MEPFGVLNLIKTLLDGNQKAEDSPPPVTEETQVAAPPPTAEEPKTPAPNPYLAFASAHEARAKKFRK